MYDVGFMQIPKEKKSTTHSNIEARDLLSVWIARSRRELARLVCPSPIHTPLAGKASILPHEHFV